ncbi:MAG TPA: DUF4270 family protein [Chitinophagaceae bacterium]|nr:DUF4270 family protein [Chitinophagaceae bacterium]
MAPRQAIGQSDVHLRFLQYKKSGMNIRAIVIGGFVLAVLGSSCTKQGSPIGANYIKDKLNILYIDTETVSTSTLLLDSVPTSGYNTILVGNYQDPFFGNINASSYMEIGIPSFVNMLPDPVYDSLRFILRANGYSYGDTTQSQQVLVYPLNANLKADITGALFNVDQVPILPTALGKLSFMPEPGQSQYLSIPLSDSLGSLLTNLLSTHDPIISDQANFRNFFKGIALVPGQSATDIMGYYIGGDTAAVIRLYFHYPGLQASQQVINFPVFNNGLQFNHIAADRSSTVLSGLTSLNYGGLSSRSTNHESFIESGVGIATKIGFPYLSNIQQLAQYGTIIKAILLVKPMKQTYRNNLFLSPELLLVAQTANNFTIDTVYAPNGSRMNGNLIMDPIYNLNTVYTYDVTNYVTALLNNPGSGIGNLVLVPPGHTMSTTVTRTVLGDMTQPENNIQLVLFYIVYNQIP